MFDFDAGTWVEGRTRDQSGSPAPPVPAEQSLIAQDLRTMEAMMEAALYVAEHVFRACSVIDRRMSGLDPGNWTRGFVITRLSAGYRMCERFRSRQG